MGSTVDVFKTIFERSRSILHERIFQLLTTILLQAVA